MRFCEKCQTLFYESGRQSNGCPADGKPHKAAGYRFVLDAGASETPTRQANWLECSKCQIIFFNGYKDKGRCRADGGQHRGVTLRNYGIPHNIPGTAHAQTEWEYCLNCKGMFYDGYPQKGPCAAGGEHVKHPDAYRFVLTHDVSGGGNLSDDVELNPVSD